MSVIKIGTANSSLLTKTLTLTDLDWCEDEIRNYGFPHRNLGKILKFYRREETWKEVQIVNTKPTDFNDKRRSTINIVPPIYNKKNPPPKSDFFSAETNNIIQILTSAHGEGTLESFEVIKLDKNSSFLPNLNNNSAMVFSDSENMNLTSYMKRTIVPLVFTETVVFHIGPETPTLNPLDVISLENNMFNVINPTNTDVIFAWAMFKKQI